MSINGTLSNALSGLVAASRAAEVVSSNIANSLTEGYGRRELQVSATSMAGVGAGVRVDGIRRDTDTALITDRREADAQRALAGRTQAFFLALEDSIGLPGQTGSLNDRVDNFEAALIEAASRPDSQPRLVSVLNAAQGLADKVATISRDIQSMRAEADDGIERTVDTLNNALKRVADLNRDIRLQIGSGRDPSALMDQRQVLIDSIADIVPIRELPRDHGEIALISQGGAILLDGKAADFGFVGVGVVTPDMTMASGALGRLRMNGELIDTARQPNAMSGGSLDALFRIRDTEAVAAQSALDGFARDLVERFQDPALDPTLGIGAPGLFTDRQAALDLGNEVGLSARIAVNSAVDPAQGGQIWRLRTGLGAIGAGDVGDAAHLKALAAALQAERVPPSGGFIASTRSASGLASDLLSRLGAERHRAEADLGYATAKQTALKALELQGGVDSDHELQQLLLVEQAYAANARVVKAVDEMVERLLGL